MIIRTFISALLLAISSHSANATVCGFGTSPERGDDGVLRCVAATPNNLIKPSTSSATANPVQSQAQVTQSTQSTQASGGSAHIGAPSGNAMLQDASKTETNNMVLPAPAMAAQLPSGFCTTGRSVQFSLLGVGYGSSSSNFDDINYKKCMALALAMRSQTTQELVMAHCTQSDDVPRCVRDLMSAMQAPQTIAPVAQAEPKEVNVTVSPVFSQNGIPQSIRRHKHSSVGVSSCAPNTSLCYPVRACEPIRLMGVMVNCK
jgi:hypothetical protein